MSLVLEKTDIRSKLDPTLTEYQFFGLIPDKKYGF